MPISLSDLGGMTAEQLRTAVATIDQELVDMNVNDRGQLRDLNTAEQAEFQELTNLRDRAAAHLRVREAVNRPGARETAYGSAVRVDHKFNPYDGENILRMADDQARSHALRALETRYGTEHLKTEQVDKLDRLIRSEDPDCDGGYIARRTLLTENSAYRSAWSRLMAETHPLLTETETQAIRDFQSFERHESRAMSEGTTTAGGFGVPVFIDPTMVLTGGESNNPYMEMAKQVTVTTSTWKGVSTAGVSWSFDTEGTEVSDDSPVLSQPTATVFMARGWVPYSIEVSLDYAGLAAELAKVLAAGYIDLEINKLTNGNGTTEVKGIITYLSANTNVRVRVVTPGAFVVADIYAAWAALPPRHRANASWLSSTDIQNRVRQLGATYGANFTEDLAGGPLQNLLGRPYRLTDYMPQFPAFATTNAPFMIVGDWSSFVVARNAGMNIEPVPTVFGSNQRPTGQRGAFAWARVGATTNPDNAFRLLGNVT